MKNNRRDFLKFTGLSGLTLIGSSFIHSVADAKSIEDKVFPKHSPSAEQHFNMSGYGAPKIDTVRVGHVGLGQRGPGHLRNMLKLENVQVTGVCDIRRDHAEKAVEMAKKAGQNPKLYTDSADAWKEMVDSGEIDLLIVTTPWQLHAPMCLYAMEHDVHVASEVPIGLTMDDYWNLIETSERTKKHCMMLENCCYDFFELLTLNMARQGYFGDIVHGEGAYNHNLLGLNFDKSGYYEMWRLRENAQHKGNLYPTHGLGPICQIMDINRGDQMDYLVSMSSNDFLMAKTAEELASKDPFFAPYVGLNYRGNMSLTSIRTHKGRTILVEHDVTSPNVYSRIHKVVGTKGTALKYPLPGKISNGGEGWIKEEEMKELEKRYEPPIVTRIGEIAKEVGGHGGMDFLLDWRLIDCLRNGLPLDQDVYDAALWSCLFPLSEYSVMNKSQSVDIPDFTRGAWKTNKPVDIELKEGANTGIKS